jgi:hypothetical protein
MTTTAKRPVFGTCSQNLADYQQSGDAAIARLSLAGRVILTKALQAKKNTAGDA